MAKGRFYGALDGRRAMLMAAPFCAIFAAQEAQAVDHNPTNLATLRTALIAVNGSISNDRIFLPAGTITLDAGTGDDANLSGDLDITKGTGTLEIIAPARLYLSWTAAASIASSTSTRQAQSRSATLRSATAWPLTPTPVPASPWAAAS